MSGGIILREEASWIVAGWAAKEVARHIRRFLTDSEATSILERLKFCDLYPGSLADYSHASPDEVRHLLCAAEKGLRAAEAEGATGWALPEFQPGFLARFKELVEMLAADPRVTVE